MTRSKRGEAVIDLTGKTSLITGGSRGIGRAATRLLAAAGSNVVVGYHRSREAAENLIQELALEGHRAVAVPGDVCSSTDVEELFNRGREVFGSIDIVIGNAGIWKRAPIDEMSEAAWHETIEVNLTSIYHTCRLAALEMKPRKSGRIILVSSTAGQRGEPFHAHYAATKGAVISMVKSLAAELGPWGIRVNAVAPGWVETDMSAAVLEDRNARRVIEEQIPLGYIPSAKEAAGPILFLASDLSLHVHGEVLNVNGGSVLCA